VRRARKVDGNQREIVRALRAAGRRVEVLSDVGRGVPDLLVAWAGRMLLVEVKEPGGKLTPDQERWIAEWPAPVVVVRSVAEALAATGVVI